MGKLGPAVDRASRAMAYFGSEPLERPVWRGRRSQEVAEFLEVVPVAAKIVYKIQDGLVYV